MATVTSLCRWLAIGKAHGTAAENWRRIITIDGSSGLRPRAIHRSTGGCLASGRWATVRYGHPRWRSSPRHIGGHCRQQFVSPRVGLSNQRSHYPPAKIIARSKHFQNSFPRGEYRLTSNRKSASEKIKLIDFERRQSDFITDDFCMQILHHKSYFLHLIPFRRLIKTQN